MKKCSLCNQTYTDETLNFCLNDGGTLEKISDVPPTVFMNPARATGEVGWANNQVFTPPNQTPINSWQQNQPSFPNPSYMTPNAFQSPNQTLPVVSLILGICGVVFCCYGFPFGIAALITGYLGYSNFNKDPNRYGGRGLAIAGLILGFISLIELVLVLIFATLGK